MQCSAFVVIFVVRCHLCIHSRVLDANQSFCGIMNNNKYIEEVDGEVVLSGLTSE